MRVIVLPVPVAPLPEVFNVTDIWLSGITASDITAVTLTVAVAPYAPALLEDVNEASVGAVLSA